MRTDISNPVTVSANQGIAWMSACSNELNITWAHSGSYLHVHPGTIAAKKFKTRPHPTCYGDRGVCGVVARTSPTKVIMSSGPFENGHMQSLRWDTNYMHFTIRKDE